MVDWNLLVEKTKSLSVAGMNKAKDLSEIARLNLSTLSEEEKIKQAYMEIGKRYVEQHEGAPELGYEFLFQKVEDAKEAIRVNKEMVAKLKTSGGITDDDLAQIVLDTKDEF